jgi:ParB/RepB/Spo0J family partition protein
MTELPPSLLEQEDEPRPGEPEPEPDAPPPKGRYIEAALDKIDTDDQWNSRSGPSVGDVSDLKESIVGQGLLNPPTVRERTSRAWSSSPTSPFSTRYQVVAGFRRVRAVRELHKEGRWGSDFVTVNVVDMDDDRARLANLAENLARKNLRLYDEVRTVGQLDDAGVRRKRIMRDTGLKEARVLHDIHIWHSACPELKERWSKLPDPSWEPPRSWFLEHVSRPSEEQMLAWRQWSNDEDNPGDGDEALPEKRKRPRKAQRRTVLVIREAMSTLGRSKIEQAQKRALLWALGRRETF